MKRIIYITILVLISITLSFSVIRGTQGNISEIPTGMASESQPFESSHERAPFAQMLMIINYGRFDLTKELADWASPDTAYQNGKFYSLFPPGVAFSMIPLYQWGTAYGFNQLSAFMTFGIFTALATVFVYLCARDLLKASHRNSLAGALIYLLASSATAYITQPVQHSPATFFLLSSLYGVHFYAARKKFGFIGLLYAYLLYPLTIFFDYPNAILLLPVMILGLLSAFQITIKNSKIQISYRILYTIAAFSTVGLMYLHIMYNQAAFGSWNKLSQFMPRYTVDNIERLLSREELASRGELINENNSKDLNAGVFNETRIPRGLHTLLIADDKGLFYFFPIYLIGILGVFITLRKATPTVITMVFVLLVNLFLYASFGDPWGGWAYGPRYLIPSMGLLAIFIAYAFTYSKHAWFIRTLSFPLYVYSTGVAILGSLTTLVLPPRIEADYFQMSYGITKAWQFLQQGKSGSYLFNSYLNQHFYLMDIFMIFCGISIFLYANMTIIPDLATLTVRLLYNFAYRPYSPETFIDKAFLPIRNALVNLVRIFIRPQGRTV